MADALGAQWVRAGHEVWVGGRDEGRAAVLAGRIGAVGHGSLRAAAEFGDGAVLNALPYAAGIGVVGGLEGALRGRVVVDCGNPVGAGFALLTEGGPSAAERLAAAAPGARVVKAFNLCHESVWRLAPPVFDGRRLAVPVCGDDEAALGVVRELVRDIGCVPYDAGGLGRAGLVEATAALLIGLWVGAGVDAQAMVPPVGQVGHG
ncbi:putative F420-dependent NADP reductase [Streptomyces aurantiacus JA 4570]|uniref:Putative F420-dependent NADP reductase n=2 Tax=Streptomyces aurantiacus TaxID=47760 RepID=S3ZIH3_9ACTN|nr:putative F420-dependent NADP reductase [Streptomyces aurantiacus JA 4570]